MSPLFAFGFAPGPMEIVIIGIVFILLFGKRVPEVARSLGSGINQFKAGLADTGDELKETQQALKDATKL